MSTLCEQCGNSITGRGKRFCSNTCRVRWANFHNNPAKRPDVRAKISAARVGKPTTTGRVTPPSQRANISKALRGRVLTEDHKAAIGRGVRAAGIRPPDNHEHLHGPAHPNWKGGTSTLRNADFSNPQYIAFRDAVLTRDDWTCVDCGQRGGRLHVHHLKAWAEAPELRYETGNGITVCRPCHTARHRGAPKPKGAGPRTLAARLLDQREV